VDLLLLCLNSAEATWCKKFSVALSFNVQYFSVVSLTL